jgi:hypothetical protein
MTTEFFEDANQLRASDGPLERMTPRDEDPTEKSLLVLIEERASRKESERSTGAVDPSNGHPTKPDDTDASDDRCCLDRTMMRLGGNGF